MSTSPCIVVAQLHSVLRSESDSSRGIRFGMSTDLGQHGSRFGFGHSDAIASFRGAVLDRFVLVGGVARWHTPAPRTLYRDSLLLGAAASTSSSAVSSVVFGFSYRVLGVSASGRSASPRDRDSLRKHATASHVAVVSHEPTLVANAHAKRDRSNDVTQREPIVTIGALFRLGPVYDDQPNTSTISSVDLLAAGSWLVRDVEAVMGLRYLVDLDEADLGSSALAMTLSALTTVSQTGSPVRLGAHLGCGWYRYETKSRSISGGRTISITPQSWRTELALTLTGAPSRDGSANATVGVKLVDEGIVANNTCASVESRLKLLLVFSSDFALFDD